MGRCESKRRAGSASGVFFGGPVLARRPGPAHRSGAVSAAAVHAVMDAAMDAVTDAGFAAPVRAERQTV